MTWGDFCIVDIVLEPVIVHGRSTNTRFINHGERMTHSEKLCLGVFQLLLMLGCAEEPKGPIAENKPAVYVDRDGLNPATERDTVNNPYPYMLMADGQRTLNDRCPVRLVPMNLRLPAVYVNGKPMGFC